MIEVTRRRGGLKRREASLEPVSARTESLELPLEASVAPTLKFSVISWDPQDAL